MDFHIPDGLSREQALARTTHLAIGAHADDLEIMAYHGIAACYDSSDSWFGGIVASDGAGCPRTGPYASLNDDQMAEVRQKEQRQAADLGHYSFVAQLEKSSAEVKNVPSELASGITGLLNHARPEVIYLHNPADKHPTHIAVLKASMEALRNLTAQGLWKPKAVYGCEVWRDLDWLSDDSKIALDCSAYPDLSLALIQVFDSQVSGGKRYDLAALGRRHANATFSNPRTGDAMDCVTWAVDLMPLLDCPKLTLDDFMLPYLEKFKDDVIQALK